MTARNESRTATFAVSHHEEQGPGSAYIPTLGYPTSAADMYRVQSIVGTGHEGWNSCYTDVATCNALARVVDGDRPVEVDRPVRGRDRVARAVGRHRRVEQPGQVDLAPRVPCDLRRQGGHRILVFVHQGTLCVNHTYGKGFSMEPGTLDHDMMMI